VCCIDRLSPQPKEAICQTFRPWGHAPTWSDDWVMARRARFGFADRPACAIDVALDLDEIAEVRKPSASGGSGLRPE
jgi:hypothetical protein